MWCLTRVCFTVLAWVWGEFRFVWLVYGCLGECFGLFACRVDCCDWLRCGVCFRWLGLFVGVGGLVLLLRG